MLEMMGFFVRGDQKMKYQSKRPPSFIPSDEATERNALLKRAWDSTNGKRERAP